MSLAQMAVAAHSRSLGRSRCISAATPRQVSSPGGSVYSKKQEHSD